MTAHAADRLSLTLPDWRTALKRRVHRPRRPDPWKVFFASFVATGLACVARDVIGVMAEPSPSVALSLIGNAVYVVVWWPAARDGMRAAPRIQVWMIPVLILVAGKLLEERGL